ncbi:MAG: hypothetical protein J6A01_06195 [Proteobacteria bacterium]|nr:hypothetical protein [Pseudomonadota bacterium]
MKTRLFILLVLAIIFLSACSDKKQSTQGIDITDAADTWRYTTPEGTLQNTDISKNVDIRLTNRFPVWRDSIGAAVDISIKNISKSHLGARGLAHLIVYTFDTKEPIYWSNIDIALGAPADPGIMSVLSLPVGASKDFSVALLESTWESIQSQAWPDKPFYMLIPTGKYLMRFEFELYDESDKPLGTLLSNFIRFTTVLSSPETIIPQGEQK